LLFHYKDARVHCAVLKKRAGPGHTSRVARLWSGPLEALLRSNRHFRTQQCALGRHSLARGSTPPANRRKY